MAADIYNDKGIPGGGALCHACGEVQDIWAEIQPTDGGLSLNVCSECLRLLSSKCRVEVKRVRTFEDDERSQTKPSL